MKRRLVLGCSMVLLVAAAPLACADDVLPSEWRGEYGTVTAGWDYWGPSGPGPGASSYTESQIEANPGFGLGMLDIAAMAHWNSNCYVQDVINGRTSVLEVNSGGGLGPVGFGLLNYDNANPEKWIRLQITSMGPGVMDFYVADGSEDPGQPPWPTLPLTHFDAIVADAYDHGDGWVTRAYDLTLVPNPAWENILLDWGYLVPFDSVFIDQVVIDTRCVPEPSTAILLGTGILGLCLYTLRRRAD